MYSQTTLPVAASSAITRSCSAAPRPTGFCTYTRSPITTGVDRPPYGTRHRKFSPFSFQRVDEAGLPRDAVAVGPSELGPVADAHAARGLGRERHTQGHQHGGRQATRLPHQSTLTNTSMNCNRRNQGHTAPCPPPFTTGRCSSLLQTTLILAPAHERSVGDSWFIACPSLCIMDGHGSSSSVPLGACLSLSLRRARRFF